MRPLTLHEALLYGHGNERAFLCPAHGDSRPSASVNVIKQVWYCYTCGARGGLTGEDALIEPDYEQMKIWFENKMEEGREYPEAWLSRFDAGEPHGYWVGRVGVAATTRFRLGYDVERNAATYPLRSASNAVLGVVRRSLDEGGSGPKYLYPAGVDVGRLLFNYSPGVRRNVVLVEGAVDAIALWNIGVDAFAVYGSRISSTQAELINRCDPTMVYTAFDNDDAGWQAHREVRRVLRHHRVDQLRWPRSWGKDVAELTEERRKRVCAELVSPDVSCVESSVCRSPASIRIRSSLRILSSKST